LAPASDVNDAIQRIETEEISDQIHGVVRISAPDGFAYYLLGPAAALMRQKHPRVGIEIIAVTRHALQQSSDIDIEIVVGQPQVNRAEFMHLCEFSMGFYASKSYIEQHGIPQDKAAMSEHPPIYFVDSKLQVDALD